MSTKDATMHLRLPADVKARFEASANAEGRSLSNWALQVMTEAAKRSVKAR